jgi:hypothetical protein
VVLFVVNGEIVDQSIGVGYETKALLPGEVS